MLGTEPTVACWACGAPSRPADQFLPARYLCCSSCGFVFAPERSAGELHELYDADYFGDHAGGGDYAGQAAQRHHEAAVRIRFLRHFAPPPGRLLETGAAGGHFVAAATAAGYDVTGVEPVRVMAEQARAELGVQLEVGFLEEVELAEGSFDVAVAFHVLEHIADPVAALERMRAALRPGGLLVLEVPNVESVAAQRGAAWGALEPLHHVGHYAPRSARAMLEKAGFALLHTETVPFFTYLRPAAKVRPTHLAHRLALSARARVAFWGPHPSRHELLRVVGRAAG